MTTTAPPPTVSREQRQQFEQIWAAPPGVLGFLREINNIPIGTRYMLTGFTFFLVGGVEAVLLRIQLGTPENTFLDPATYNQIFTMHGTTMMFLFVIPFIEAISTYMMPLLLGTRDLPFPQLTALSYWTYLFGGIFLYSSFIFGVVPDAGWTAYVPLAGPEYSPGINLDFWDIGLAVAEVAAIGAAVELIVSVLRMRAPGMSLTRMPIFAWSMLVTAFMIVFAFTPLIVGTALLEFDRKGFTAFFDPAAGGKPLLWQHLFWIFGHPEVYIMFIPAAGMVSHVVQTFSRRPLVAYPLIVLSIIATGFISFGLWVHHMFSAGVAFAAMSLFTAASLAISIPNGIQVFSWLATIWTGRPQWRTPLLFVAGFIIIFVIGGLTGVMVASVPFDWQVHDTHFVVAHFHYVLIGGVIFPFFAALYYWLPKITGRMLSERLGAWNAVTMFIFFNLAFFPMHISGLLGMPRRVYTYPEGLGLEPYNLLSTIGAVGFAAAVSLFLINFLWSLRNGPPAGDNPWGGDTLEWSQSSPPPQAQFQTLPVVRSRHPLWEQSSLDAEHPGTVDALAQLHWRPIHWRGALVVSPLRAEPEAIVHVPRASYWPLTLAVAFVFLLAGAVVDNLVLLGVGTLIGAIALTGWFWPRDTERRALEDAERHRDDDLPLAIAGPRANGWWGAVVALAVLGTALITLVGSYFYLGPPAEATADAPALTLPLILTALAIALAVLAAFLFQGLQRDPARPRAAILGAMLVLTAISLWLSVLAPGTLQLRAAESAHDSIILGLFSFQWVALFLTLCPLGTALAWAWRRPRDPRGRAAGYIAVLLGAFAAASWLVVGATVYLGPGAQG